MNLRYTVTSDREEIDKMCVQAEKQKMYSRPKWELHRILLSGHRRAKHLAVCMDLDTGLLVGVSVIECDYLHSICSFVKPKYRRLGIGSKLVHILVSESGAAYNLTSFEGNKAVSHKFWTSLGFVKQRSREWRLKPEDLRPEYDLAKLTVASTGPGRNNC